MNEAHESKKEKFRKKWFGEHKEMSNRISCNGLNG